MQVVAVGPATAERGWAAPAVVATADQEMLVMGHPLRQIPVVAVVVHGAVAHLAALVVPVL
jgi:hypothetical protein